MVAFFIYKLIKGQVWVTTRTTERGAENQAYEETKEMQ